MFSLMTVIIYPPPPSWLSLGMDYISPPFPLLPPSPSLFPPPCISLSLLYSTFDTSFPALSTYSPLPPIYSLFLPINQLSIPPPLFILPPSRLPSLHHHHPRSPGWLSRGTGFSSCCRGDFLVTGFLVFFSFTDLLPSFEKPKSIDKKHNR